jgi:hypothetical protein
MLLSEANRADPATFNVCMGSHPDAVFSYRDDDLDVVVSWLPHPNLVPGTRQRVIDAVGLLPRAWLVPPMEGEVFNSAQDAEARVLGYSLAAGFQIVTGQGSTRIRRNFQCKHHGEKPQNNRKLEDTVTRDPKDKKIIISNRKRNDTRARQKNCKWRVYVVPFTEDDDEVEGKQTERWILRIGTDRETARTCDWHSHEMAPDPFVYLRHSQAQPSVIAALPQATSMRDSSLLYRQAERILYGQGLRIDRRSYYNLARRQSMGTTQDDLLALVSVLEYDGWIYRTFWDFINNDQGVIIKQVLKAVFFTNNELIRLARRFCPDWMIQMDGTFNTNRLKMPLIDVLGVTNTEHSFLFTFCFVTSESADNWSFVLQCLEQTVFKGLPLPRVVIADQGMGL